MSASIRRRGAAILAAVVLAGGTATMAVAPAQAAPAAVAHSGGGLGGLPDPSDVESFLASLANVPECLVGVVNQLLFHAWPSGACPGR